MNGRHTLDPEKQQQQHKLHVATTDIDIMLLYMGSQLSCFIQFFFGAISGSCCQFHSLDTNIVFVAFLKKRIKKI